MHSRLGVFDAILIAIFPWRKYDAQKKFGKIVKKHTNGPRKANWAREGTRKAVKNSKNIGWEKIKKNSNFNKRKYHSNCKTKKRAEKTYFSK